MVAALDVGDIVTCESTIRRTLKRFDATVFDPIVNTSVMVQFGTVGNRRIITADGKAVRGADCADGHARICSPLWTKTAAS